MKPIKSLKNIYILMGESGSGKTSVQNILCNEYFMKPVVSYTTREPRYTGEDNHIFISKTEFDTLENKAASVCYSGSYYCATTDQVDSADIYTLDVDGFISFTQLYRGNKGYRVIYIQSPEYIRAERMERRGDKPNDISKRISEDRIKFKNAADYADFTVKNNGNTSINNIVNKIWNYIEKCEVLGS